MSKIRFLPKAAAAALIGAALQSSPAAAVSFVYSGSPGDAFSMKIQGVTTEANTHAGSDETTWGWGYVTSIENASTFGTLWQQSSPLFGNATLAFMIYGIADLSIVPGGFNGFQIYNVGCTGGTSCDGKIHVDFYLDASTATGGTNPGPGAGGLTTADRTGFDSLNQITTDGTLFMKWEFTPGGILDNPGSLIDESIATLFQDVTGATLPASGLGFFDADCVAGPGCNIFGNAFLTNELQGDFTLSGIDSPTDPRRVNGWAGVINDPVTGIIAAPAPATAIVFGTALLGLIALRRRA
jgi:hypothetical protein